MESLCINVSAINFFKRMATSRHRMLDEEQIRVSREQLARFGDPSNPGQQLFYEYHSNESSDPAKTLFHALGAWRVTAGFHDLLWNPSFLMPASQLLGGPVRFWHDQIFSKPAHHGGLVAWHQDYSYWTRTRPMAHLSCWIGLDDATVENGCVHYVPGSHKWDLLPVTGLADNMDAIQTVLSDEQRNVPSGAIELKAGEASFHHPLMVHGSFRNSSDRPRRAAVLNVFADGVRRIQKITARRCAAILKDKDRGQFFPLFSSGERKRHRECLILDGS